MKHFIHTDSALCLLFCFAEQGMVAASTWVMIQIGKSVGEPGTAVFWVLVFMAVLLAVFVPKYGYDRFLLRAKYRTQGNYILAFGKYLSSGAVEPADAGHDRTGLGRRGKEAAGILHGIRSCHDGEFCSGIRPVNLASFVL